MASTQVRYFLRPRPALSLKQTTRRYTLRARTPLKALANALAGLEEKKESSQGYVYLIREREFVRMKENVFKIGRSKDFEKRFASYPKNSEILACAFVQDQFRGEKRIIQSFDKLFTQRDDIGREYYEGERHAVIHEFLQLAVQLHNAL